MEKKVIKAGLIGFGTIGKGVVKLFKNSGSIIDAKSGVRVELKKICDLDIKTDRGVKVAPGVLTTDINDIINDPEIDIVIELMGGYRPAFDFVLRALNSGKNVVSANKAMISKYWRELRQAAQKNGVSIMCEASVGGGIPILRGLEQGLAANRIIEIRGILNGTCNYILTKMTMEKMTFDAALREAQQKGFAEADPTFDIEGYDTMHKAIIISNMSFDSRFSERDVAVQGIKGIDFTDIQYADELGYVMKLLAIASRDVDGVNIRVQPSFVPKDNMLASVNYEFNAIYVKGDAVGETLFYGRGAGEMPTASAVLSDIIHIARNMAHGYTYRKAQIAVKEAAVKVKSIGSIVSKYYLRFSVSDRAGVLAQIAGILGRYNISIESVLQKARHSVSKVPVVIMTYEANEADLRRALKKIDALATTKEKTVVYRVIN
ncbi:MAG: homoserine dehydrogenase [Spirochaetia bacterium]|nr:homoserine dehydrogenase [Spirochaetia bacterium]